MIFYDIQVISASLSAINIEIQCFIELTPDFTPKNVKSGVLFI